MMTTLLLWLALAFQGQAAILNNGFVVGNGGDGIRVADRIYLRDLAEMGAEENPFIGAEAHPDYVRELSQRPWRLSFRQDLLARKLTDLDKLRPGLGRSLLDVILLYQWVPVNFPLATLREENLVLDPGSADLVQIANRLDSIIRVHQPSWELMPESHQIALFIHEALYSLSDIACYRLPPVCSADVRFVREYTGRLFLPLQEAQASALAAQIPSRFRLPEQTLPMAERSGADALLIQIHLGSQVWTAERLRINGEHPPADLMSARKVCDFIRTKIKGDDAGDVRSDVQLAVEDPRPFFFTYTTSFGRQQAVAWSKTGVRRSVQSLPPQISDCERSVRRQILDAERAGALLDRTGLLVGRAD